MAKLYVFRHGQTEFNANKIFTGWQDSKLTELGIEQAQVLARLLLGKQINIAYQTRLSRSQDTLKEVLVLHPECKEIITDDRMIERSYGDLAGKTHLSIIEKYGEEQFKVWHRDYFIAPPGGESFVDVEKRVQSFIEDIKHKYQGKDLGIAISAHGNSIRIMRKLMEGKTVDEAVTWTIPYDHYFEYEL